MEVGASLEVGAWNLELKIVAKKISKQLTTQLAKIKLFLCDVDGVMTDGTVYMGGGVETKRFGPPQLLVDLSGIKGISLPKFQLVDCGRRRIVIAQCGRIPRGVPA